MLSKKKYLLLMGYLFSLKVLAALYYYFIMGGMNVTLNGYPIPPWLIIFAVIADSYLAYEAFRLAKE